MTDSVRDRSTITEPRRSGGTLPADTPTDPSGDVSAWWRLWAIAALAHVASNMAPEFGTRGIVNAAAGFVALMVVLRPNATWLRSLLAAAIVASAIVELPVLGNHWLLAAGVSLAALASGAARSAALWRSMFAPSARALLLIFYSFAAFAKLNTGFLDPVSSCARFFAERTLDFWQLGSIPLDGPVATLLPFSVAAVELSVPILLVIPRTRRVGVWLAITFHLVLTVDLIQHFFDFTLVLIPLFLLFARPGTLSDLDARLPRPKTKVPSLAAAGFVIVAASFPLPDAHKVLAVLIVWGVWLVLAFVIVRHLVLRPPLAADSKLRLRPSNVGTAAVAVLFVVNGLSPYLELKTSTAFNMYANLRTASGESNHLIVRRTWPLRDDLDRLVAIQETNDAELAEYRSSAAGVPRSNLRAYLSERPDTWAEVIVGDGEPVRIEAGDEAAADAVLGPRPDWLPQRIAALRSVPLEGDACQATWLPAR